MPLAHNTVVYASAGTGKTRKLVETWVSLVEGGSDPLRIVAMTFTEKAAADMRARIREAISEREHARWTRVLSLLPAAPISTIHGFCGLLLREHGLQAGVDPSFSILDELRSLELAREAAVDTIRSEIRGGNEKVARLFGDFGLDGLVDALVRTAYWMNSLGKDASWLLERAASQRDAANELQNSVIEHLEKHGNDFERLGVFVDEQDAKKAKHSFKKKDDPDAVLPRIGQIAGASVSQDLSELVRLSVERFRLLKRTANAMDFDDLLLETRNLLRDSPRIRHHCQMHFQAVLVDEFQDTDEVQAEIVRLLTRDPEDETRFAPGKLMIVGDRKQSIYRFRRARVTVFVRMMKEILDDGGKLEHLRENWRSAPPLAEFSNRLSELMMDGKGKEKVSDDVDLSYRIPFEEQDVLIPRSDRQFQGITYIAADTEAKAAVGRPMEAEAIARLLKSWRSAGTIQSWQEVAVLMRGMNNAGIYIDALESHGIPVHVVEGTSFYQKNEVSDLIALLELVLHPDDPAIRAIVRTSSLVGLSFNDLLEGKSSPEFEAVLAPWIEKRDSATAAEILEDVIRKTSFDVVMTAQKNGVQRAANIGKLIEITRNLARQGTTALDDVVRHLRARATDMTVREPEAQTTGQDADVVRLLTVHRAKGLEFDVVIVPDLAARTGGSSSNSLLLSDRWGILAGCAYGLHRKTLPHALILRGKDEEDDQQFEEEKRLLYVAVTRARRMLVLGEGFSGRAVGLWHRWVGALFENVHPGALERARDGKTSRVRFRGRGQDFSVEMLSAAAFTRPEQLPLNIDMGGVQRETAYREFQDLSHALETRTAAPSARSGASGPSGDVEMTPSDLAALEGCFRYFHWTRLLGLPEPGSTQQSGGASALRLGSLAHEILERESAPSLETLQSRGVADLHAVFASKEWQSLGAATMSNDVERELPFIMHIRVGNRDCFIRGRMDAVVAGSPPRVIDYKYALWRAGVEADYEIQMTAYSLALMKSAGIDSAIAELWYLKSPMKVMRQEYTREQAERRISALVGAYLEALSSGAWPMAAREHCDAIHCGFRERCWYG
jgi:ATP-dependent helicase/nuclease subunit A